MPRHAEADPVVGSAKDLDPIGSRRAARRLEDRIAICDPREASGIVCVAEMLCGTCLDKRVCE